MAPGVPRVFVVDCGFQLRYSAPLPAAHSNGQGTEQVRRSLRVQFCSPVAVPTRSGILQFGHTVQLGTVKSFMKQP